LAAGAQFAQTYRRVVVPELRRSASLGCKRRRPCLGEFRHGRASLRARTLAAPIWGNSCTRFTQRRWLHALRRRRV